jgi:hypothetical protein
MFGPPANGAPQLPNSAPLRHLRHSGARYDATQSQDRQALSDPDLHRLAAPLAQVKFPLCRCCRQRAFQRRDMQDSPASSLPMLQTGKVLTL